MTTIKAKVEWGLKFVADMLMDSLYEKDSLEQERHTIFLEVYNTRYLSYSHPTLKG